MPDLHPEVLALIEAGPLAVEVDHDTGKVKKREHPQEFARRCVEFAVEKERDAALKRHDESACTAENADLRAKLEAEHDIRADRETVITLLAESLNVNAEPHQSFFDRLCEAAEEATKDAERYQFFKSRSRRATMMGERTFWTTDFTLDASMEFDAAIDAAIAQGKGEK